MSNNKESSVEWLYFAMEGFIHKSCRVHFVEYLEQAKAMHKEECIKYYVDSVDYGDMGQHIRESLIQIAEKMYNETFGGKNE